MLTGLSLLYVGAVLCLNGLWMLGRIDNREIFVINLFAGVVTLLVSLKLIFGAGADLASVKGGALTLLFTFTYFWVAINQFNGADGRGLGWFSLFVAVTATAVAFETLGGARSLWGIWFGLSWVAWAVLWLAFFMLLALKKPIGPAVGRLAIAEGVLTGWLPGYLLLSGVLH